MALDLGSAQYVRKKLTLRTLSVLLGVSVLVGSTFVWLVATAYAAPPDQFITTWKTDNPGVSSSTSIRIPTTGAGYNYDVDWNNDGVFDQFGIGGDVTHDFGAVGTYTIRIQGNFPRIYFFSNGDCRKIVNVDQWGTGAWTSMREAFSGATNLTSTASDAPNLTSVTDTAAMFAYATSFNGNVSAWDVSNVTNMSNMFLYATSFNGNVSAWDTSKVTNMSSMFTYATSFNGNVSAWDVSNVTNMAQMFSQATSFNGNVSAWDVSNVTDMSSMFSHATSFNGNVSAWDVSNVTDMSNMFYENTVFNGDVSAWDVRNVTYMDFMFAATSFNGDVSAWDTSNVRIMAGMFYANTVFNGDVSAWDTSKVTNMSSMFNNASSFNRNLGMINMSAVTDASYMLAGSGMSIVNYDATLKTWALQTLQPGVSFSAVGLKYCISANERQYIINTFGWAIYDDGKGCQIYINSGDTVSIEQKLDAGGVAGTFSVANFGLRASSPYTLGCTIPGSDDSFFSIGGSGSNQLLASQMLDADIARDANTDNAYDICVRANDGNGNFLERNMTIKMILPKKITGVAFVQESEKGFMIVSGTALVGYADSSEYSQAFSRSLVTLNDVALPFCTFGGYSAQDLINIGVLPGLVSESTPCYQISADGVTVNITPTQVRIWLPDEFDAGAPGAISVNGSPVYVFNTIPPDPVTPDPAEGPTVSTPSSDPAPVIVSLPARAVRTPTETKEVPSASNTEIAIEGKQLSLTETMEIMSRRPTFSGSAVAGASITITADTTRCAATVDDSGSWVCTLADDLASGRHSIMVAVTTPDGVRTELGPYPILVKPDEVKSPIVTVPNDAQPSEVSATPSLWKSAAIGAGVLTVLSAGVALVFRR